MYVINKYSESLSLTNYFPADTLLKGKLFDVIIGVPRSARPTLEYQ